MALPQDGQDANGLTKVTEIPAGKELMFIDPTTNEGGIITLENLTKQILNGLTTQAFKMDTGTQTIPAAINYLFGNSSMIKLHSLPLVRTSINDAPYGFSYITSNSKDIPRDIGGFCFATKADDLTKLCLFIERNTSEESISLMYYRTTGGSGLWSAWNTVQIK